MRAPDRRHLLPGAAAFSGALLVGLLGLNAGADEPPSRARERVVDLQLLGVNDSTVTWSRPSRVAAARRGWERTSHGPRARIPGVRSRSMRAT